MRRCRTSLRQATREPRALPGDLSSDERGGARAGPAGASAGCRTSPRPTHSPSQQGRRRCRPRIAAGSGPAQGNWAERERTCTGSRFRSEAYKVVGTAHRLLDHTDSGCPCKCTPYDVAAGRPSAAGAGSPLGGRSIQVWYTSSGVIVTSMCKRSPCTSSHALNEAASRAMRP